MSPWLNVNQKCKLPVIAVSKPHKYLIVKGKFLAWHESWKSPLRPNNNKKLNKLKTQQLFLAQSEKWDYRANLCPLRWRDQQMDTENPNLPEQKPTGWNFLRTSASIGKVWTVFDKMLEALCRQVWDMKTLERPRHQGSHNCELYILKLYQVLAVTIGGKSSGASSREEWERNHFEVHQCIPFFLSSALRRN
jgi:hypothetical protein